MIERSPRGNGTGPRLGLFMPDFGGGGAERVMLTLASGFVAHGADVDLVVVSTEGPLRADVPDGVRVVELGGGGVMGAVPALASYLRRARPSSLLSTLGHANVAAVVARALARTGTPLYVREASAPAPREGDGPRPWKARMLPRLKRWAYRRTTGVIAVSRGVRNDLVDVLGVPADHTWTLPNPIVGPDVDERARAPVAHPWFDRSDAPVVLTAGRLVPSKDQATLLRAFARLRDGRHARLVILGEGPEREALEAEAVRLGIAEDVALLGFVPDVHPYMARASLFALSSRREGLPGVLIQALACGLPVVSTDCPWGAAEVLEDGRYGHLVSVGDDAALASAMACTLDAPPSARELRRRSADYSVERSVRAYFDLLSGRGAPR